MIVADTYVKCNKISDKYVSTSKHFSNICSYNSYWSYRVDFAANLCKLSSFSNFFQISLKYCIMHVAM